MLAFARAAAWETGGGARPVLAACGVPDGSPRCHRHPRVYTRVQGAMASGTVVPLHKPDRARLPRAWQIGLSPHVAGFDPPAGSARRPGGASFNDTPVRALTPLLYDMSEAAQKAIIAPFTRVWMRASPKGCVWVCPLRGGDAGIGPVTKAVMGSVDQNAALAGVHWRTNIGDDTVKEVLTRFRHLADPLGLQKGVLLADVCDPLCLGSPVLFVNQVCDV